MRAADVTDGGVEEVMGGEVQKPAVELDVGTEAGQDDAFEAVIADFLGNALEVMKGVEMSGKETRKFLIVKKLDIEHFAERQDHKEAAGYTAA